MTKNSDGTGPLSSGAGGAAAAAATYAQTTTRATNSAEGSMLEQYTKEKQKGKEAAALFDCSEERGFRAEGSCGE